MQARIKIAYKLLLKECFFIQGRGMNNEKYTNVPLEVEVTFLFIYFPKSLNYDYVTLVIKIISKTFFFLSVSFM